MAPKSSNKKKSAPTAVPTAVPAQQPAEAQPSTSASKKGAKKRDEASLLSIVNPKFNLLDRKTKRAVAAQPKDYKLGNVSAPKSKKIAKTGQPKAKKATVPKGQKKGQKKE